MARRTINGIVHEVFCNAFRHQADITSKEIYEWIAGRKFNEAYRDLVYLHEADYLPDHLTQEARSNAFRFLLASGHLIYINESRLKNMSARKVYHSAGSPPPDSIGNMPGARTGAAQQMFMRMNGSIKGW